ncbi:YqeG family HAD IIIA-type phosphatase [Planktothrix mougeotii]|uniref:YqeG family HAD IIIA-type phosphatase n=1 Tax=Planktothrix mougeotii LEGE 06226 TaxID=1828728 RepID=A0ABR9UIQ5_9CYAN|nr:YqeG family HAD IIIA-type phosphatase [Planktothrix mougeotii]MBE9146331.1 YqeG family HAD IIIA-type phosphatase [Planktothrix mougeotii LEGE 06226]
MSWGKLLQPDLVLGDCVVHLTPDLLEQHQIKGMVLDVDETLVPITEKSVSEQLKGWIDTLKPQTCLWLVSNNISQARIGSIAETLNLPYISGAGKPSRRKLKRAVEAMDLPVEQVAMVGDRLFTDVLAGNRLGMFTILVEPMVDPTMMPPANSVRNIEVWLSKMLGATLH